MQTEKEPNQPVNAAELVKKKKVFVKNENDKQERKTQI
jgi:hypothetical protein